MSNPPRYWADLIEALTIMASHPANDVSPTHCDHDTLFVMADPNDFTPDEILRLDELGFLPTDQGTFKSFRYGSA